MLLLEIVLIVVGLAAVILSYKMADYSANRIEPISEKADTTEGVSSYNIDKEEIKNDLEQIQEEAILEVSDELSRISNEKLMGMDEYSSQVLEKIEKNHGEVVFLYNMLNEKEEEIKKLVHHADVVKAQLHEEVAKEYQSISQLLKEIETKRTELEVNATFDMSEEFDFDEETEISSREELNAMYDQEVEAIEEKEKTQQQYFPKKSETVTKSAHNHNNEIIALYKKGHSVLEISRMLSLGQGEVKFVIDLYEAK